MRVEVDVGIHATAGARQQLGAVEDVAGVAGWIEFGEVEKNEDLFEGGADDEASDDEVEGDHDVATSARELGTSAENCRGFANQLWIQNVRTVIAYVNCLRYDGLLQITLSSELEAGS